MTDYPNLGNNFPLVDSSPRMWSLTGRSGSDVG